MLTGEYEHSLDDKGRLILPAKCREALSEGVVITRGMDECLFIMPRREWMNFEDRVRSLSLTKSKARQFTRLLFSGATEEIPTKQGRILISANLREYAGLKKDVVIIGVGSRLEIWDRKKWSEYRKEGEASFDDIAEEIDLGTPGL